MFGIPVALAVFGAGEWATHRFLFRFHQHHQAVRAHGGYDPAYEGPAWSTPTQAREALGLSVIALAHLPLLPVAPFYTATIWYCLRRYRQDHRRAHLDPRWARDHLTWHYEHHMADQAANFGVVWAWFDLVVGTRAHFVGTDQERVSHAKAAARITTAQAGARLRAQRRSPLRRLVKRLATASR
jgi:sterol desaturase/sphingolipid hydroxylase (fatty acid hydroxylase superfamily)